ncbi:ATP-dependent helicase HrpB [Marinobacterium nitratireducens]|uniref:ATP-dependent helicase HrpB n=1 Tax=Marinobacterium nitratireducens TaxID=518897 RepID=A0A917Z5W8_9GAMM|nr:ATP-dependent helicase HrpB [Marinobacterium nitratireducens]GGO75648.1 ATP-dependent helicase HrpB [Marinobacterium nitratireducens]
MLPLPIDEILPELRRALRTCTEAVLEAPPGAGKTTRVPLALLDEPWLGGQKILMLEPRRLAARAAAERLAASLGEPVGQTVGYRIRFDSRVGPDTRIEVVTEGILTRLLQSDPSLEGTGLLIFDEFHERSLDADLGLALALQGRELLREDPPLRLLLMSATLDGEASARLLGGAPIVRSEGRSYPVEVRYGAAAQSHERIEPRAVATILDALASDTGSVLVFLPGQREIRRTERLLRERLGERRDILLAPLYGDLGLEAQRQAIAPAPAGVRKVVLATAIAETSLTIQGVRVVIDCGLSREAIFDPATGMTRLQTRRLSRDASVQRAGRAGRLEPGICYRLWSESQQQALSPRRSAEILQADLAPLALQLVAWGVSDPGELRWLDPPAPGRYAQALDLLTQLGAVTAAGDNRSLTRHGERMARLPAHPRIAHLLLEGRRLGVQALACEIAALLSDRDPLRQNDADIGHRLAWIGGEVRPGSAERGQWQRLRQQRDQFRRLCERLDSPEKTAEPLSRDDAIATLIATAYPDRIATRRQPQGLDFRLANGRAARLDADDPLRNSPWLALAQVSGRSGEAVDRIRLAAPLDPALFQGPLRAMLSREERVEWSDSENRLVCERQLRTGQLIVRREPLPEPAADTRNAALCALIRKQGLGLLPWTDELHRWRRRVAFLRHHDTQAEPAWPDLSDDALLGDLEQWLAPWLDNVSHRNHFARLDLGAILEGLLPWPLPRLLDERAPTHFRLPSGHRARIDYAEDPPVLAVKLQELFGCTETPKVGTVALKLHLLSPAQRPLQVTQDLVSFWNNSYREVQKDMKGRYPKHHWPDDPMTATPGSGVKRRSR